jgi:molybdopterin molybdotransferase
LRRSVERVSVERSFHRVSSGQVVVPHDVPMLPTSHMDGYAVIQEDIEKATPSHPLALKLVGGAGPGARPKRGVAHGEAVQVATGAILPSGADTVVPKEYVELREGMVMVKLAAEKGSFVYGVGDDFQEGDVAVPKGHWVKSQDIGLMIGLGFAKVDVWRRPTVTVIATGSELTRSTTPRAGKIRESHSPVFMQLVDAQGCVSVDGGVVRDDPRALASALRRALRTSDFVVTLGGTSAGGKDLIVDAVSDLHPDILIHGIKLDRGRVTGIATVDGRPVLMMPGPIQAAMNAFLVLGIPLIQMLSGREMRATEFVCKLGRDWEARKRFPDFKKVVYVKLRTRDETVAEPILGETESMGILTNADGYILVPEGVKKMTAGSPVKVRLVPGFSDGL